jgi:nucleoside-diphosphate-sugar epimerase
VFSEDIANKMTTLTYGFDVAQAITCLINEPEALGEAYHVTQREACRWSEILGIYLDVLERYLGARPKVLLLGLDDFSRCKPCEYQIKYDRLFNRVFDSSKIADFANVNAFLPLRERLTRCLEEFLEKPQFSAIDWRAEAIKDRHSGEVATLDEIGNWRRKVKYLIWRYIRS